jgi:hypothetical protein
VVVVDEDTLVVDHKIGVVVSVEDVIAAIQRTEPLEKHTSI